MNNHKFLPYAQPFIFPEDVEEVSRTLTTPVITRGPMVEAFEQALASYCGVKYAVAFTNATAGLAAAYHVAKVGPSDRIITTPNSFVASVGPGIQRQATPIFIDIDRQTGNFNLEQLSYNINRSTSRGKTAVVPVHFSGIPVDMKAVNRLVSNPDTIIIEDAAHALGSHYQDGSKVGCCTWSDMTVFSFHPSKTITTGEGGMVTTNDDRLYHELKRFRNNGIERDPKHLLGAAAPWYYEVMDLTGNFNFTEMQAALGLSQLKHLNEFVARRQELMNNYRDKFSSFENIRFFTPQKDLHIAYHLCVVQIDFEAFKTSREKVMKALLEKDIGTQVHYIPIYRHPFFVKSAGDIAEYFPETEAYYAQALSLPLFFGMVEEDVERVVNSLKDALCNS